MKHLRKTLIAITIMLATILVLTGCGAGGSTNGDSLDGTWKCSSLDMGSGDILGQLGSAYPESMHIVFSLGTHRLMTEEEMKAQLQGSDNSDLQTEQSYRAELKDGKLVMNMGSFYDDSQEDSGSSSEAAYKMEFTFDRSGDAPASLDDVKTPAAALTDERDSSAE